MTLSPHVATPQFGNLAPHQEPASLKDDFQDNYASPMQVQHLSLHDLVHDRGKSCAAQ